MLTFGCRWIKLDVELLNSSLNSFQGKLSLPACAYFYTYVPNYYIYFDVIGFFQR